MQIDSVVAGNVEHINHYLDCETLQSSVFVAGLFCELPRGAGYCRMDAGAWQNGLVAYPFEVRDALPGTEIVE